MERAIKRVRSDLAAHVGLMKGNANSSIVSTPPSENGSIHEKLNGHEVHEVDGDAASVTALREEGIKEEEEEERAPEAEVAAVSEVALTESMAEPTILGDHEKTSSPVDVEPPVTNGVDEETPATPIASENLHTRMHRSHSADPDKSSRISRAFTSSVSKDDSASSQTGDDSSISTTGGRPSARKKRFMFADPNKEVQKKKSQRKVVIDDFEMMRVLGKGCAGKVLLVKHRSTTDLYALKAITKRHVLAHQELQHTLTEQAVLKRMAAESKDPFVVKLWWSFHDKENLFLVMVR